MSRKEIVIGKDAVPPVGNSAHAECIRAIQELDAAGGGRLIFAGKLSVSASIEVQLSNDLEILFDEGAELVAAPGMKHAVLRLTGVARRNNVRIVNPRIDCSSGVLVAGKASCTAIAGRNLQQLIVNYPTLYGGARGNQNADTGFGCVSVTSAAVNGGTIEGFSDAACYVNGSNRPSEAGDGLVFTLNGTLVQNCRAAITGKRKIDLVRAVNVLVDSCDSGFMTASVVDQRDQDGAQIPYVGPARRLEVLNCRLQNVTANCVRFRSESAGYVRGTTFEDWGAGAGAKGVAVVIQGASGIDIDNNRFQFNRLVPQEQVAIAVTDLKERDGKIYRSERVSGAGNHYRRVPVVLRHDSMAAPVHLRDEVMEKVGKPLAGRGNSGTSVDYTDVAGGRKLQAKRESVRRKP